MHLYFNKNKTNMRINTFANFSNKNCRHRSTFNTCQPSFDIILDYNFPQSETIEKNKQSSSKQCL